MSETKIALESLSMDLLRVALGYYRGSKPMARRFSKEALKRIDEIDPKTVKPYLANILNNLPGVLSNSDKDRIAEDVLMYSTICKNYARCFL